MYGQERPGAKERTVSVVYLVGAGPGDPELLTIRALRILAGADIVLYDSLVEPAVLNLTPSRCERVFVGKRKGRHSLSQARINERLLAAASAGQVVVRLKGGDPFLFGRGGEELEFLRAHDIRVEVIPGVTTASAAAAVLQVPLTHRELGRSVVFITGYSKAGPNEDGFPDYDWSFLAREGITLVIYMGLFHLGRIARKLLAEGRSGATPVAVLSNCTHRDQRVHRTRLDGLETLASSGAVAFPAIVILGDVVGLGRSLAEIPDALPASIAEIEALRETMLEGWRHHRPG